MATKFATLHNPWTGATLPQHMTIKKAPAQPVDVSGLIIANDPLPACRSVVPNKYAEFLAGMKIGQNIRCQPGDVGKVQSALRKHIDQKHLANVRIVSQTRGTDGLGRVWLLAKEVKKLKVAA